MIGRGGMGIVVEARHVHAGQRVALKVLAPERMSARDGGGVRRFLREAEILSRLEHPGLVRVLDHGDSPEHGPWIAMEYVAGEVLRARLARATDAGLPLAAALSMLRRIASAVAVIHAHGIIHRDLKPENIMVTPDDEVVGGERVKLLDFGIAKIVGDAGHTTEGTVLGTAGYLAPEQCAGESDVGPAADVYAVGVLGFELLTGALPFSGRPSDVMRQHLFAEPPFERLPEALPAKLARLIRDMLAKEPTRRPEIADVVMQLRALEVPGAGDPEDELRVAMAPTLALRPESPRSPPSWRKRLARAAALATALLVGIVGWRVAARHVDEPAPLLPGMVRVPTLRFAMGSTPQELAAACAELPGGCTPEEQPQLQRELPVRRVTVSAFQIDAHEVTNREYVAFLTVRSPELRLRDDADDHYPRFVDELASGTSLIDLGHDGVIVAEHTDGGRTAHFSVKPGQEDTPVEVVTWDGAARYCRHQGKRLPTEAEWEAAARGADGRRFPWGDEPPRCDGVAFGRGDKRGCPDVGAVAPLVGSAAQDVSPEGIHDLAGSVSEWVADSFVAGYRDCGACVDPVVEETVPREEDFRIMRGGNYLSPAWFSRTTTRSRNRRAYGRVGLGFRCATR